MTTEQIENVWRNYVAPIYREMERARLYVVNGDAKRHLVFLWRACKGIDSENAAFDRARANQSDSLIGCAV
jgi:hypothetical protein